MQKDIKNPMITLVTTLSEVFPTQTSKQSMQKINPEPINILQQSLERHYDSIVYQTHTRCNNIKG